MKLELEQSWDLAHVPATPVWDASVPGSASGVFLLYFDGFMFP